MPKIPQPALPESAGVESIGGEKALPESAGVPVSATGVPPPPPPPPPPPVSALPKLLGSLPPVKQKGFGSDSGIVNKTHALAIESEMGGISGGGYHKSGAAHAPAFIKEEPAEEDGIHLHAAEKDAAKRTAIKVKNNVLHFNTGSYDFRVLGHMTVTFKPGPVGMRFHDETGMILDVVQDSQAEELGVKTGMLMCRVGGQRFSRDLFLEKLNGPSNYKVFFAFSLEKMMSLHGKEEGTRMQFRV